MCGIVGLVELRSADSDLEATTRDLCERLIDRPPIPQWIHKKVMREAVDSSLETTMVMTSNASGILHHSDDAKEARRAFVERRKPDFTGR